MNFVVIIAGLLLLQWRGNVAVVQRDGWFLAWLRGLQRYLHPVLALALAIAAPALLIWLLWLLLAATWYGVPLFLIELLILLYSLGRGDFRAELDLYQQRWRRGDLEAAYQYARQLDTSRALEQIDGPLELHERVRGALLYRGLERWFAVVFWFALAGPAAGLVYRLLHLSASTPGINEASQTRARTWLAIADWLPARLLGLSFALVGNFADTMAVWRRNLLQAMPIESRLVEYQQAAQQVPISHERDAAALVLAADQELSGLMALLARSVVLWILVLAMVQLL